MPLGLRWARGGSEEGAMERRSCGIQVWCVDACLFDIYCFFISPGLTHYLVEYLYEFWFIFLNAFLLHFLLNFYYIF